MNELPVIQVVPQWGAAGQWWENFFNASPEAQIVCRRDGIVEHINPRAALRFELAPAATVGVFSIFKLLSAPSDRKLAQILQAEHPGADTLHSVSARGDGMPGALMDLEIIPLDQDSLLVTFKDSSRRQRLESHVQRLVTAIDATPDVFLVTDASLRITYVNPAFQSATGYGLEEVLGRSDEFLRAPSEQEKAAAYRDCTSRGCEWIGELINVRRNGEIYHVEATISPIADIAGRFMGYVACERDITLRRQLQTALRLERDFVQSILQSLDGAIYSLNCEFRLTHANAGWRQLPAEHGGIRFNGPPGIGRALLDYVPDSVRRGELRLAFEEVIGTGRMQDNHFHSADGRYWLMRISPWKEGATVRGLICNVVDETHYHELQNQLFQAQKMEIIGTLAAGVAHDFNNLLQAIRGHTSLIMLQAEPGTALRSGLEKIDLAAVRASDITQQLLSFSRASDDRRAVLDLNLIIKEASQFARRSLRGNVSLELTPSPASVPVKLDPTRASQALLNLCMNAQDAMPAGGKLTLTNTILQPAPEVLQRHDLPPGELYARCSVADTGCGISPELLSRIFQPFFTTKENGKGTGLGLAIVQRVAQEGGGFIEVESTVGQGTVFHLYLPLALEALTPVAAPKAPQLAHGTGCVLVVDDVDLLRDFAQSFLEISGLTVRVAGTGAQALEVLEELAGAVDLVFTDYNMPGMNGVELIERIAARWPKIKFMLASGYLDEATRARLGEFHTSILTKPYDLHDASEIALQQLVVK